MEIEINYTRECGIFSKFYGSYGKMKVRNSGEGVLITHKCDLYDHQKRSLGMKIVSDICNQHRSGYEQLLSESYSDEEKKDFCNLLNDKIKEAQKSLDDLMFAQKILKRKKVIFKKGGE